MSGSRFAIFLTVVLTIWGLMHAYVFWRLGTIPWIASHSSSRALALTGFVLWFSYPLARILNARKLETIGVPLEFAGAVWMGTLFLMFAALLAVDLITAGGFLLDRFTTAIRGGAVVVAGILSLIAIAQGLRAPLVVAHEVRLKGLPPERDGLNLVVISDLHLGTLKGERWLTKLLGRVDSLKPDLMVIVGDLVDGNVRHVEPLVPLLQQLRAPLGVWAVTGNHEYYAGLDASVKLLEDAGFRLLRNRWAEATPGLAIAGVDDLTAREQFGQHDDAIEKALSHRPVGSRILLSHSPLAVERVAAAGANLMLSGHTHAGQVWPFNFLVQLKYPRLAGRFEVDGMTLIVCRGTGTWGPPMRLWRPSEILRIKLRAGG
jgi:predicted MPP superfamily phosphohydrolase